MEPNKKYEKWADEQNVERLAEFALATEDKLNKAKKHKQKAINACDVVIRKCEREYSEAIAQLESYMKGNGVLEEHCLRTEHGQELKICFEEGSEIVVVGDDYPTEFARVKTEPDKIAMKKHLKEGHKVNWASLECGEDRLVLKWVKAGDSTC